MGRTRAARMVILDGDGWKPGDGTIRVRVVLEREDGGYSVHCRDLAGAHSQGDTEDDALANIREAVVGAIRAYRDQVQPIPWGETYPDGLPHYTREVAIWIRPDEIAG